MSPTEPQALVLGLDIGGTKLAAGIVDPSGAVRSFLGVPTRRDEGPEKVVERLLDLGRRAVDAAGVQWAAVVGVGVACGGPLDAARGVISPVHLPGWHDVPLREIAERAYGLPVVLDNDATAAAAGEHRYGAGAGVTSMVYLTLSTGVGGGVIVDGRPYRGTDGNGAELGHVTIDWRGRACRGCGRRGCLEAYVSGTSIAERAREAGLGYGTAEEVAAAALSGDGRAARVWDETVEALACGLTSIVNVLEPELVVIGGGVSRSGEHLIAPVRERVHNEAMTPAGKTVEIVSAALGERVGVVGAAAIVLEHHAHDLRADA